MKCEAAFMPLFPSLGNQTQEGQPAPLFAALVTNLITAALLVVVSLILGIYLCSFMLSAPKIPAVGLNVLGISYIL